MIMSFDFFGILIYFLLVVLLAFVVKAYLDTQLIKENKNRNYLVLQEQLLIEKEKCNVNTEKLRLADNLQNSLFTRLFKITKEIILLQKLIFDKQS